MKRAGLRIGEVATLAGVNIQTLRYYERRGILEEPKRTLSGYREYPSEMVRVIQFIKRAQELGFTLSEVEELLELREHRPRDRRAIRELAAAKLRNIEEKIRDLEAMKKALDVLVDSCACKGMALECPILEALEDAPSSGEQSDAS